MSDSEKPQKEQQAVKTFNNEDYSQWVELKNNYPRFFNYRENDSESGYEEIYRLRPGFYIRVLNVDVHLDSKVALTFAGGHLIVCLKLKGLNSLESKGGSKITLSRACAAIYYFEEDQELIDHCDNDEYLMVMLVIDTDILGADPLGFPIESFPDLLKPALESMAQSIEFQYQFGADILSAAQALVERKVNNDHLRIYLESKSIELLCLLLQDLSLLESNIRLKQLPENDIKALEKIKQKLDLEFSRSPSVADLAIEFNITESRLKTGFTSLYGMPIRSYLHGLRMQSAQQLLIQNTLNIDMVADRLGYNHSSNFIAAFKRHFGMTPKSFQQTLTSKIVSPKI